MLIERVRAALARREGVVEKQMVGGRSFMIDGRLVVGVVGENLMVRLTGTDYDAALHEPSVRPMKLGSRTLKRYLLVAPPAVAADADLMTWLERASAPESGAR